MGSAGELDLEEAKKVYCDYLKSRFQLPCEVKGSEDFNWEEPYVIGGWDKKEYDQLKKTQPSYRDCFELLGIKIGPISEWMLFGG